MVDSAQGTAARKAVAERSMDFGDGSILILILTNVDNMLRISFHP